MELNATFLNGATSSGTSSEPRYGARLVMTLWSPTKTRKGDVMRFASA